MVERVLDVPIRLLLADDSRLLRTALANFLDQQPRVSVVGEIGSIEGTYELTEQLQPDIVLLEIRQATGNGIEVTARIRARLPHVEVLVLTDSECPDDALHALRAGAKGYLLKSVSVGQVVQAIETVHQGGVIISPEVAGYLQRELTRIPARAAATQALVSETVLTEREWEVLELIRRGHSNREIGRILCISESTVKSHLHRMLGKLHLTSRTQMALYAQRLANPPRVRLG